MLKKVLSLLAVCMFFGLTAFAANPNDATVTGNKVSIGKYFKLQNDNTTSPEETFYLVQVGNATVTECTPGTTAPNLKTITDAGYSGTDPLVGKVTFAEGAAKLTPTAADRQNFEIELPAYTAVGVYEYTLREVNNKTGGVTYWNHDIKLFITVAVNDEGKYYVSGVHAEENIDTDAKADNFTNKYSANTDTNEDPNGGIGIKKTVSGSLGDRDRYFDFTITFKAEAADINYATAPTVTVAGGSHTHNPASIDLTSLTADDPVVVNFKLKHGETIRFGNVPYGVTYTYAENDYSSEGYTTTKGTATDVVNTPSDDYEVTNDKDPGIDTGIFDLDDMPYVMTLVLVMLGGVVFFIGKKRKIEDRT